MDINKLRTFLIAAETGNLQSTARKIFRTQPAVTQQIQKLEQEIGMKLFEKHGRKLILTCQGEALLHQVKQPMMDLEYGIAEVLNRGSVLQGTISVGVISDHAVSCDLFKQLASFCLKHQKVNLEISLGTSEVIEPLLLENRLDFGVVVYLAQSALFNEEPLAPAVHFPVCSPKYLKMNHEILTFEDLMKADLIDQHLEFWSWTEWVAQHFPKKVTSLRQIAPRLIVPSYLAMKDVVLGGFGIAILPQYLVNKEISEGKLVRLFPAKEPISFDLVIAYRKSKILRQCEKALLDHILLD
jgi:DNA-binding transcriptional LysR family regulator